MRSTASSRIRNLRTACSPTAVRRSYPLISRWLEKPCRSVTAQTLNLTDRSLGDCPSLPFSVLCGISFYSYPWSNTKVIGAGTFWLALLDRHRSKSLCYLDRFEFVCTLPHLSRLSFQ